MPGLWDGAAVEIMDDGNGIAEALVRRMREAGAHAQVVPRISPEADAVVWLDALKTMETDEEAISVNRRAFEAAKTIAEKCAKKGGVFVTVQDTGGSFGLSGSLPERNVWTAGLTGLVKTAARECRRHPLRQSTSTGQGCRRRMPRNVFSGN
ncbi:hypothetical protein [Cohnella faecalis]|uniref:hypothetical protein n=1 Tax=Cohnella faecalis TaxID=2315694 RepID=UPI0013149D8A|nr:hypothetical protein [Cohnella faecalis]